MEIRISSRLMLKILYVLAWIIFIGLSIEAGAIIFNAAYWLISKPASAHYLWEKTDLLSLYNYDRGHFFAVTLMMSIVEVLKAILFYQIIRILSGNRLDMSQPFNNEVGRFIFMLSYLAFIIGVFSDWAANYVDWLTDRGVVLPTMQSLKLAGADVWLFMGITLFVIGHIFKRGIEIQAENNLTI